MATAEQIGQDVVFDKIFDSVMSKKTSAENSFEEGFRYGLKLELEKERLKKYLLDSLKAMRRTFEDFLTTNGVNRMNFVIFLLIKKTNE